LAEKPCFAKASQGKQKRGLPAQAGFWPREEIFRLIFDKIVRPYYFVEFG